jgi:hypothetical protein
MPQPSSNPLWLRKGAVALKRSERMRIGVAAFDVHPVAPYSGKIDGQPARCPAHGRDASTPLMPDQNPCL